MLFSSLRLSGLTPALAMLLTFSSLFIVSCNQPALSTTPSPVTASTTAPSTPPAALLVVSSFSVNPSEFSNHIYWYRPALVLSETSGNSAARLQTISFSLPNGYSVNITNSAPPGRGCFLSSESQVVAKGGSWDANTLYYYCLDLDSDRDLTGLQVRVNVTFTDDEGRPGFLTGVATVK